jgi:hypothetical protein
MKSYQNPREKRSEVAPNSDRFIAMKIAILSSVLETSDGQLPSECSPVYERVTGSLCGASDRF